MFASVAAGNERDSLQRVFAVLCRTKVKNTYTVTQAQAALPRILKQAKMELVTVTRRDEPVAFLVSRERMESFVETLELMADPAAMQQVAAYEKGGMQFYPLPEE